VIISETFSELGCGVQQSVSFANGVLFNFGFHVTERIFEDIHEEMYEKCYVHRCPLYCP